MNSMVILREQYKELEHNPLSELGYDISNIDIHKDFYTWRISLLGAKDTSYADGIFLIKIIFRNDYPHSRPEIFFLTPIYHPNVAKNGFVGVNFIYQWKPITVREILIKLYGIFYLPNPYSPYSDEQAHEFKNNRYLYELKVKYFTKKYANIKSFENIKNSDEWDFSFSLDDLKILKPPEPLEITINNNNNEKIELIFDVNSKKQKWQYNSEEKTDDAFKRFISANKIEELNILFIYDRRKLNMNKTLRNNGLKDQSLITVISGVQF